MLKEQHKQKIVSLNIARASIPKMKGLFIIDDMSDMSNIQGYLTFVSESEDSYNDLIMEYNKTKQSNIPAMIIGSYENGGAIGVQYCM